MIGSLEDRADAELERAEADLARNLFEARWAWPWRFNHAEVRRIASEVFGVQQPVKLLPRKRRRLSRDSHYTVKMGWQGWHVMWDGVHELMVVTGNRGHTYPVEFILRTLAHELRHAWQVELYEDPSDFSRAYQALEGTYDDTENDNRYTNPFEVDAEEASGRLWYTLTPAIKWQKARQA